MNYTNYTTGKNQKIYREKIKKAARRKAKRKQKRKYILILLLVVIVSAAAIEYSFSGSFMGERLLSGISTDKTVETENEGADILQDKGDLKAALKAAAGENPAYQPLLENMESYPKDLLELAVRNPETLDFVLDYPEKKNNAPAESIGEVSSGTVPYLLQWDERWGYMPYGDSIIAVSGCGPTALAMVAAGLTGDSSITPYVVAEYAEKNGYYVDGAGSSWSLMSEGSVHFGINASELSLSQDSVFNALEAGEPIICSMRPGDFTTTGHFIVIYGTSQGQLQIYDPNSRENSSRLWDYDRVASQINNLWAFTLA